MQKWVIWFEMQLKWLVFCIKCNIDQKELNNIKNTEKYWTTETLMFYYYLRLYQGQCTWVLVTIHENIYLPCHATAIPVRNQPSRLCRHTQISCSCCFLPYLRLGSAWKKIMEYNLNLVSTSCHYPSLFIRFRIHKNLPYHIGLILCKNKWE